MIFYFIQPQPLTKEQRDYKMLSDYNRDFIRVRDEKYLEEFYNAEYKKEGMVNFGALLLYQKIELCDSDNFKKYKLKIAKIKTEEQIQRDFYELFTRGMYVGGKMPKYEDLTGYQKSRIFNMASYKTYLIQVKYGEFLESLGLFKLIRWIEKQRSDISNVWWYMWNRF